MSIRRAIFWALLLSGTVGFLLCVFVLVRTGTCANGGPYVIANECPGGWRLPTVLVGSLFAFVIGGAGVGVIESGDPERPFIPLLGFVPFTRECAIFGTIMATTSVATYLPGGSPGPDGEVATFVFAGVLLLSGPLAWFGAKRAGLRSI